MNEESHYAWLAMGFAVGMLAVMLRWLVSRGG